MNIKLDYSDVKFQNNGKLKLLIIVGTRPEIIRLSAVITKCRKYFDCILAHTGQNYDYNLNGVFFKDLKLDAPEVYMDAVGNDLGATVGNIINCSYKLMNEIRPDALLVLGDTNKVLYGNGYIEDSLCGCTFRISQKICSRALGIDQARKLLREGKTDLLSDFVSPRTGKSFSATLTLEEDGKVSFRF